jgi:penicillin-binding protein 1C
MCFLRRFLSVFDKQPEKEIDPSHSIKQLSDAKTKKTKRLLCLFVLSCIILFMFLSVYVFRAVLGPGSMALEDPERYTALQRSGEMQDRSGRLMYAFLNDEEQWCFPRPLDAMSPWLIQATVAAEDQRFFQHRGVDPIAVLRAALQNVLGRRVASGASTLTMQVVKMTEPAPRTLSGKIGQARTALRLEKAASKEEILEAYLNKAPYGLNLVGAEAAARRYFGKPASELTAAEAALLAGLPKSPTASQPLAHPDRAMARRQYVLRRMHTEGYLDNAAFARAIESPLGAAWRDFPQQAPHLAMRLRDQIRVEGMVRTTLDAPLQDRVEDLARRHLPRFDGEITNAAVLVVDVVSGETLARIGGTGFFTDRQSGQVDLCRAARSPGSALKPFTYAFAIAKNLIYPSERLLDDSLDYGLYNPANFDGEYNGLVTVAEALHYSLNVPAVMTLERLGTTAFLEALRDIGFSTLDQDAAHYGLGFTIGNCAVTLEELANAYAMIANEGVYRPIQMLAEETAAAGRRVLERGVALSLYQMLDHPFPGELSRSLVRTQGAPFRVCWKTGTSTGYHDAWTVAFNRRYVVAVWLGNNDGRPSRRLIGAHAALPLAEKIFRGLDPGSAPLWPETAGDLREVMVCARTGLPASPWCPSTEMTPLPRSQYLHRRCDVHAPAPEGGVIEHWPGSPRGWDLARVRNTVPEEAAQDTGPAQAIALRIQAPADKAQYILTGETGGDRILLRASAEDNTPLHWYLNDKYLGVSHPHTPLFLDLEPGAHKLACMAPNGVLDSVRFEVLSPAHPGEFKPS